MKGQLLSLESDSESESEKEKRQGFKASFETEAGAVLAVEPLDLESDGLASDHKSESEGQFSCASLSEARLLQHSPAAAGVVAETTPRPVEDDFNPFEEIVCGKMTPPPSDHIAIGPGTDVRSADGHSHSLSPTREISGEIRESKKVFGSSDSSMMAPVLSGAMEYASSRGKEHGSSLTSVSEPNSSYSSHSHSPSDSTAAATLPLSPAKRVFKGGGLRYKPTLAAFHSTSADDLINSNSAAESDALSRSQSFEVAVERKYDDDEDDEEEVVGYQMDEIPMDDRVDDDDEDDSVAMRQSSAPIVIHSKQPSLNSLGTGVAVSSVALSREEIKCERPFRRPQTPRRKLGKGKGHSPSKSSRRRSSSGRRSGLQRGLGSGSDIGIPQQHLSYSDRIRRKRERALLRSSRKHPHSAQTAQVTMEAAATADKLSATLRLHKYGRFAYPFDYDDLFEESGTATKSTTMTSSGSSYHATDHLLTDSNIIELEREKRGYGFPYVTIYQWAKMSKNKLCCFGNVLLGTDFWFFIITNLLFIIPTLAFFMLVLNPDNGYPSLFGLHGNGNGCGNGKCSGLRSWAVVLLCLALFGATMCCLQLTAWTDPGYLPRGREPPPAAQCQVKTRSGIRYCPTCHIWRPVRAKHCRYCDACVRQFDHHCPWIGTCVGQRNYRFFFAFVCLMTALSGIYALISWTALIEKAHALANHSSANGNEEDGGAESGGNHKDSWTSRFPAAIGSRPIPFVVAIYATLVFLSVSTLCLYHIHLIVVGETTNENVKNVYAAAVNPFDLGVWFNCKSTLCFRRPPSRILSLSRFRKLHSTKRTAKYVDISSAADRV